MSYGWIKANFRQGHRITIGKLLEPIDFYTKTIIT
jgi:hypothetical protein